MDDKSKFRETKAPCIDGGYGWVIVICSFILQGISCGISLSVGVFFVEWLDVFGHTHDVTAWVGSVNTGLLFAGGPLVSVLINKFGHRHVAFMGGVISTLGLLLAAYAKNIWYLFFTYGILGGLGVCFIFIPAGVICSTYFTKLRPLAMGLACSGVGLFCLGIPPFLRLAIDHYGWRGAMIFMSALSAQSCLFSYLMFPVEFWNAKSCPVTQSLETKEEKQSRAKSAIVKCMTYMCSLLDSELLCNFKFAIYFVNNFLWNAGSLIILVMVSDYAGLYGISKDKGAFLISIIGFSGLAGRVGSGIIANLSKIKGFWIFNIATAITGVAIGLIPFFRTYSAFCTLCALYGLGFGGQVGVLAITTIDLFGAEKLSTAFGYIMLAHGLGALSGPPIAGVLYERTHGYKVPFYFAGFISLFAALLACFIPMMNKPCGKQQAKKLTIVTDLRKL